MTYKPGREQLQLLSLDKAELFGKPHIHAGYLRDNVDAVWHDYESRCPICLCQRVANAHHVCPKGVSRRFALQTPLGCFDLKSALFGLCGSGTTGCHNGFHGGARYFPRWVWNSDESARMWWEGELLSHYEPHSAALYGFGCWEVADRRTGRVIEVVSR
ncbi:MAG: hypothetical protein RSG23_04990 [Gordonibacter sp.]|uniref:hypothetical protein n=1 Tax=Gordonibacter sp. TaxID=1968902 RepID=UPI002FC9440B